MPTIPRALASLTTAGVIDSWRERVYSKFSELVIAKSRSLNVPRLLRHLNWTKRPRKITNHKVVDARILGLKTILVG